MTKVALLTTDYLLFGVFGTLLFFAWLSARKPWLKSTWEQFFNKRMNQIAIALFLFYALIAVLDSIRFSSGTLLDYLFWPLLSQPETSFSKPFACFDLSNHRPLQYACRSLQGSQLMDVLSRAFIAFCKTAVLSLIVWQLYFKRHASQRALFWTLASLSLMIWVSYDLSQQYHIWGTNKIGQDLFFSNLKSIRTAFVIGIVTLLFMVPFAVLFGSLAGYFGGIVDDIIQYIYTALSSIPAVLLISATLLSLQVYLSKHADWFSIPEQQSDARLLLLCMVLGVSGWVGLCRILRAEALRLRTTDFVAASRTLGVSHLAIVRRHLIPNMMHLILISATLDFSALVLSEAVLSYVGVGVDPSVYSWGNLINSARSEIARSPVVWWSLTSTFVWMCGLILSANLISEGFQKAFDPRGYD